jgi:hypothetical protein
VGRTTNFTLDAVLLARQKETILHFARTLLAIVLLALTFGFSQSAFAKEGCCWIDTKTGKEVPTVPRSGVNLYGRDSAGVAITSFSDPDNAHNTRTGQNFVRVPCPPPATAVELGGGAKTAPLFYRTGEVDLIAFGVGGVGHGEQTVTDEQTVTHTKSVSETTTVPETVLKDIPGIPGLTPVTVDEPVTTKHNVTTKETVKHTRNVAAIQGGFGGMGAEAKVFVTQNIGLGVEGEWLDGQSSIGTTMGTLTARFPMGSNAPYVLGGAGVQFGDRTQAVGELGGGVEHRFTPNVGVFVDGGWMFGSRENAAVFRLGISIVH